MFQPSGNLAGGTQARLRRAAVVGRTRERRRAIAADTLLTPLPRHYQLLHPATVILLHKAPISPLVGNVKFHLSGYRVYQDLGNYFRFADDSPIGQPISGRLFVTVEGGVSPGVVHRDRDDERNSDYRREVIREPRFVAEST